MEDKNKYYLNHLARKEGHRLKEASKEETAILNLLKRYDSGSSIFIIADAYALKRLKDVYHAAHSDSHAKIDDYSIVAKFFGLFDVKSCRKWSQFIKTYPNYESWNGKIKRHIRRCWSKFN